jgi:uncharacterized membrane protein YhaH (DUF805 family)
MKWYLIGLKKYLTFSGRARRKEFWLFTLFNIIAFLSFISLIIFIGAKFKFVTENEFLAISIITIAILSEYSTMISEIAISMRRLHDTNRSGRWLLFGLIPCVGWVILIILLAQDSHADENSYGRNPKNI